MTKWQGIENNVASSMDLAFRGPLKGTELETVPSIVTDWATWRRDHQRRPRSP